MARRPAIYIVTNKPRGTIYIGVTNNLPRRIWEHRKKLTPGFTAKYNLTRLVYFEFFGDMYAAISREKQLKAGSRARKVRLIESANPHWRDLFDDIIE